MTKFSSLNAAQSYTSSTMINGYTSTLHFKPIKILGSQAPKLTLTGSHASSPGAKPGLKSSHARSPGHGYRDMEIPRYYKSGYVDK
jgi:hypothetical protein